MAEQRIILKWPLVVGVETEIPGGNDVLHIADQYGVPTLWTIGTGREESGMRFVVVPTGGLAPEHGVYVGTAVGSALVWHVFRVGWTDKT